MTLEEAIKNPQKYFNTPSELTQCNEFTNDQKVKILQRWEQDAHQLLVASEEGMDGGEKAMLHSIRVALEEYNAHTDNDPSPTK